MRWARIDLACSVLASGLLLSATSLIAIVGAVGLCVLASKNRVRLIIISIAMIAIPGAIAVYFLKDSRLFTNLFGFLVNSDGSLYGLLFKTVLRGGNRPVLFLWGLDAFLQNPLTGIGFGADETYTELAGMPASAAEFMAPYFSDVYGAPFVNPFIEAGATMGLPGLVAFSVLTGYPIWRFFGMRRSAGPEAVMVRAIFIGLFVMLMTMQASGTFLRFYVWSTYGLALGVAARYRDDGSRTAVLV
jgi:O-antigen ligase